LPTFLLNLANFTGISWNIQKNAARQPTEIAKLDYLRRSILQRCRWGRLWLRIFTSWAGWVPSNLFPSFIPDPPGSNQWSRVELVFSFQPCPSLLSPTSPHRCSLFSSWYICSCISELRWVEPPLWSLPKFRGRESSSLSSYQWWRGYYTWPLFW
jgi:hypothetical protein